MKTNNRSFLQFFAVCAILLGSFFSPVFSFESVEAVSMPAMTIRDEAYQAVYLSQSLPDPIVLTEGEVKTIVVRFKNTGTATWKSSGSGYVSAFTVEPKYHASEFQGTTWNAPDQTAAIKTTVKPGGIAELPIELKAKKAGTYREQFYLAANNYTWIKGGYVYLDIKVVQKPTGAGTVTPKADVNSSVVKPSNQTGTYTGEKAILTKKQIIAKPGEKVKVRAHFWNTGTATWSSYSVRVTETTGSATLFGDTDWSSSDHTKVISRQIVPTFLAENSFYLVMPSTEGTYRLTLQLEADQRDVAGATVEIPVQVTAHPEVSTKNPQPETPSSIATPRLSSEPTIKIGLWEAPESVQFWTPEDEYRIFDGEKEIALIPKHTDVLITPTANMIQLQVAGALFLTDGSFRLVPATNPHAVFELKNFTRTVSWKKGVNYNKYRGILQVQFGKKDKQFWAINETLLEDYVVGIAETGNDTHPEYQKALLTAARTYAYYLKDCACKYGSFDVVPSTADQLFLGYNSELQMPNIRGAAEATRGMMITYDIDQNPSTPSDIVITPYFSNTDGRTRSWSDVWGGKEKPWLVSVEATYDKRDGKKLWGHGVGMSNRDAIIRAVEGKAMWEEILQYYYTGVTIERIY